MAKKVGAIVSLSIIGVLIVATIIMACVNVNYGINCKKPAEIWVSYGDVTDDQLIRSSEQIKAIMDYIDNASKEKSLTALFNGTLGKKAEIKATNSKTIPTISDGFYVRYRYGYTGYEGAQKLMFGKKEYKTSSGENVRYYDLVFTVRNLSNTNVVNVYVVEDTNQDNTYNYYYELEADFENLYSYLNENLKVGQ